MTPSHQAVCAPTSEPATSPIARQEETPAERELRLGGYRNSRVLRQELARQARNVKPPQRRIPRNGKVWVDGHWVTAQQGGEPQP